MYLKLRGNKLLTVIVPPDLFCMYMLVKSTYLIVSFFVKSESASIRDEELQGLRQQHALLKKMLEQQQQVHVKKNIN